MLIEIISLSNSINNFILKIMNPLDRISKPKSDNRRVLGLSDETKNFQSIHYFTERANTVLTKEKSENLMTFKQTNSETNFREYYY